MRRSVLFLFAGLAAALTGFGVLADRALVREARTAAELVDTRKGQDARSATLSVRGALQQLEQDVLAGRTTPGVARETLALPPIAAASIGRPYRGRSVEELSSLVQSTGTTPSALPEAVVAAVALDTETARRAAAERLLSGQVPVRNDDLSQMATALGIVADPRLFALAQRLRRIPDPSTLPEAPSFRRVVRDGRVVAWARRDRTAVGYEVPIPTLLIGAGVDSRARPTGIADASAIGVAVPDVEGLALVVTSDRPPTPRLLAARALLWLAVSLCLVALVFVQRAISSEAKAVSREKAFVAGVTHELRTPVAAIRVFGETLADGRGEAREYGVLLAEESERLEALVERVLAATRMGEAPHFVRVRPDDVLASSVTLMQPRATRRGVTLDIQVHDDLGDADWDGDGVRRAVLNLIDNAIKHGRANGKVQILASSENGHVRISVRDDGPGIARREQRRVFGRFQRGTTDSPGTGLGLYLVDEVARAHGGRVDLASGDGTGCTFTLVLPRIPPATALRPAE